MTHPCHPAFQCFLLTARMTHHSCAEALWASASLVLREMKLTLRIQFHCNVKLSLKLNHHYLSKEQVREMTPTFHSFLHTHTCTPIPKGRFCLQSQWQQLCQEITVAVKRWTESSTASFKAYTSPSFSSQKTVQFPKQHILCNITCSFLEIDALKKTHLIIKKVVDLQQHWNFLPCRFSLRNWFKKMCVRVCIGRCMHKHMHLQKSNTKKLLMCYFYNNKPCFESM